MVFQKIAFCWAEKVKSGRRHRTNCCCEKFSIDFVTHCQERQTDYAPQQNQEQKVRISTHRIEKNIFLRYNETNWIQFNSAVVTHTPKETKKWLYGTTNFGRFSLTRK